MSSPSFAGMVPATAPAFLRAMVMSKARNKASHAARAANTAMRFLRYLRRRPAALKIVSSDTPGKVSSLSFAPTFRHKLTLGSAAWSGKLPR